MLLAAAAAAQSPARVLPSRDVAVAYRVAGAAADAIPALSQGDGQPALLRLAWDAAGQRLRVEAEGRPEVAIIDLRQLQADIVEPALHAALALPMRARDIQALTLAQARLSRRGLGAVLGHACTVWAVQAPRGAGTLCLTEDGVALRGDGVVDGRRGGFVAVSLTYAPQAAELFAIPAGYTRLQWPRFGRAQ